MSTVTSTPVRTYQSDKAHEVRVGRSVQAIAQ
jgi:hypothetical protein